MKPNKKGYQSIKIYALQLLVESLMLHILFVASSVYVYITEFWLLIVV